MSEDLEVRTLPLPDGWPRVAKRAVLCAVSLAETAWIVIASRWLNCRQRARVEFAERLHIRDREARLREELRIKDARMAAIAPRNRPRYRPADRLAILELQAASGWSTAKTARAFMVDPDTVRQWRRTLDEEGAESLTRMPEPVNRYPQFLRMMVKRLKALCPAMGRRKLAEVLARAALHIAPTTVARMRDEEGVPPGEPPTEDGARRADQAAETAADGEPEPQPERVVTSKRPNHVGHVDLTVVPTFLGGFFSAVTGSLPTWFPFCWWLAVYQDHFSRRLQAFELFKCEPTSQTVQKFLARAFESAGAAPKHLIMDKGRQFDCDGFREFCGAHSIRYRYGAAGKKGSIAVIERLIRSIKDEFLRRIRIPLVVEAMHADIQSYADWYNEHRPHEYLRGRTPNEVYFDRPAANEAPRYETRLKYPRDGWVASPQAPVKGRRGARLDIEVTQYAGRPELPIVALRQVA